MQRLAIVNPTAQRRRNLGLALLAAAVASMNAGCSSAAKSNYLRHLSKSLEPTRVTMQSNAAHDLELDDESGMRLLAAAETPSSTPSP